jgi:hypothetical protein
MCLLDSSELGAHVTTTIQDNDSSATAAKTVGKIRMTPAMKEGLDSLQREYDAFRKSSLHTLSLINDYRVDGK